VVGLALSGGVGAILANLGVSFPLTLLFLPALILLKQTSKSPGSREVALFMGLLSGVVLGQDWMRAADEDCRFHLGEGSSMAFSGRLLGPLVEGRGEILPTGSGDVTCVEVLSLVAPRYVKVTSLRASRDSLGGGKGIGFRHWFVALGGRVQARLRDLFPRTEGLARALVWARKDGLTRGIKGSYARAGTAHLLAISGFHVGVVAGVLLVLLGFTGLPHPARLLLASLGVWTYVTAIGLPDAAFRAAMILTLLALGRTLGRSVAPLGALATAFLGFLVLDPGALVRPGFQLSFAGALGLVAGYRPVSDWIARWFGTRLPGGLRKGIGAGVAATLATLPFVAWHFGRVSLVGIPMTLVMTPLVALAIPGIFLSLLVSLLHWELARFLASGIEVILWVQLEVVSFVGSLPFASFWISQTTVVAGTAAFGAFMGFFLLGGRVGKGMGRRNRYLVLTVVAGVLLGSPVARLLGTGTLELIVLDVGQGDAILIRSPKGRWSLIDAGPRTRTFDAGASTILPYLRKRGAQGLDLLILTHPDLDHVGGAASILREFPVGGVLGPGLPAGSDAFLDALEAAQEAKLPWGTLTAGDSLDLDGVAVRVLAPRPRDDWGREEGNNDVSVVMELRYGAFSTLLTGDAPLESEERFIPLVLSASNQVLKVGHHGSRTSTGLELLERIHPEAALISVGRRNRFGHPDPEVLSRLQAAGVSIHRTDLGGSLVVRARRDGSYGISDQH
jgi:competence protein ComEC